MINELQDEKGNWLTYTFDENSFGMAQNLKELTAHSGAQSTNLDIESAKHSVSNQKQESYSSTNNFFIDYEDSQVDKGANTSINRMKNAVATSQANDKMNEYVLTYISPSIQSLNHADNQETGNGYFLFDLIVDH